MAEPAPIDDTIFRNRIVGTARRRVDQLLANPNNFRIHPRVQQDALLDSGRRLGTLRRVLENVRTGNLVDGHLRVLSYDREGIEETDVTLLDLSPEEELAVLVSFDPLGDLAVAASERLEALRADSALALDDLLGRRATPQAALPPAPETRPAASAVTYANQVLYRIVLVYPVADAAAIVDRLDALLPALGPTYTDVVLALLHQRFGAAHVD